MLALPAAEQRTSPEATDEKLALATYQLSEGVLELMNTPGWQQLHATIGTDKSQQEMADKAKATVAAAWEQADAMVAREMREMQAEDQVPTSDTMKRLKSMRTTALELALRYTPDLKAVRELLRHRRITHQQATDRSPCCRARSDFLQAIQELNAAKKLYLQADKAVAEATDAFRDAFKKPRVSQAEQDKKVARRNKAHSAFERTQGVAALLKMRQDPQSLQAHTIDYLYDAAREVFRVVASTPFAIGDWKPFDIKPWSSKEAVQEFLAADREVVAGSRQLRQNSGLPPLNKKERQELLARTGKRSFKALTVIAAHVEAKEVRLHLSPLPVRSSWHSVGSISIVVALVAFVPAARQADWIRGVAKDTFTHANKVAADSADKWRDRNNLPRVSADVQRKAVKAMTDALGAFQLASAVSQQKKAKGKRRKSREAALHAFDKPLENREQVLASSLSADSLKDFIRQNTGTLQVNTTPDFANEIKQASLLVAQRKNLEQKTVQAKSKTDAKITNEARHKQEALEEVAAELRTGVPAADQQTFTTAFVAGMSGDRDAFKRAEELWAGQDEAAATTQQYHGVCSQDLSSSHVLHRFCCVSVCVFRACL